MAKKSPSGVEKLGHYAFFAGIILAILASLVPQLRGDISVWILVILGVVVGLLNVTAKEVGVFLIATMALIMASAASALSLAVIWSGLTSILGNIIIFVAPAAIIVALKAVYVLAEER